MITTLSILILIFIGLNAFFAGSETALTSLNKIKLRHLVESKNNKAIVLNNFLKDESHFLGTTLVGTNISIVISSVLATHLFTVLGMGKNAALVSTIVMTTLILIFGEIIPKAIFRQSSNAISLVMITPLRFFYKILYPIIFIVSSITKIILKPVKAKSAGLTKPFISRDDIEEMLIASKKKEFISGPDEKTLIRRIFKMGVTTVGKIMTPLAGATLVRAEDTTDDLKKIASSSGFSRFPAYEGTVNNIIGIINVYDILFSGGEDASLKNYIKQSFFISEKERVDRVLHELRKRKKIMAIVIDSEGKSIGLITIEDLLEELVGEIGG
ncbi:MAG: HlyC/CorC family transporter [Candidatus Omnitrophica bacterium]|nr:HlyC/CorC family transporter [Candidatus Omnitrophota bacterium]